MLRTLVQMLRRRWRSWVSFELLYQVVYLSLIGPLLKLSVDAAMALAGYSYLTWENIGAFVLSPATIVVAVAFAAVAALMALFELAGLHYSFTLDASSGRPKVLDAARFALRRVGRAVRPANIAAIPYLLVLLPFLGLGTVGGMVRSLAVPEFVMEYIQMNTLYALAYLVLVAVLFVCVAQYVFLVVFLVADDVTFAQAARMARLTGKGHVAFDVARLMLVSFAFTIGIRLLCMVAAAPALLQSDGFELWWGNGQVLASLAVILAGTPISYAACLAVLQSRGSAVSPATLPEPLVPPAAEPFVLCAACVVAITGSAYFTWAHAVVPAESMGSILSRDVELTAHRGGTFGAPENTMAAFEQAKRDGADVCELDVQQSSDGMIFVSHDSNFKRISGVDKGAWELAWAEVCELDATGSYWQGSAEPQRYPLLDEVIAWAAKNDMRLNIELKPTGHEVRFEESVADIVRAHDFADRCIVTSQVYDTVARIKEYAPEITCTYVTTLAYGDLCQLDAADVFSLEETSATPAMVACLHEHGKQVLAWVVNSKSSMRRVMGNGVDTVITDDVPLARGVIDEANDMSAVGRSLNALVAMLT